MGARKGLSQKTIDALEAISRDRTRTNLLHKYEQTSIAWLVQRVPSRVTSDMLTAFGFFGSFVVFVSFLLASLYHREYLLLGVAGFIISWVGDSLDGRLAYYRKKPRKLYGFALDITFDWMSIILIGCGYIVYSTGVWELMGYGFVVMYGWEMIIVLMKYKITGNYSIDSGKFSPTEVRLIISGLLIAEVLLPGSLKYSAVVIGFVLFIVNVIDTRKLLILADKADEEQKKERRVLVYEEGKEGDTW